MSSSLPSTRGLAERLSDRGTVLCAGGYLFEVERRGYLAAGAFVPEVALDHPEVLEQVTRDFCRAGSDVSLAFTYNGHREKMRIIGKEDLLEPLNRSALQIARKVAAEWEDGERPLVAGNISNTNLYDPADPSSEEAVRAMYREMCEWAAEEGVDFMQAETLYYQREAEIALEEIQRVGLPSVLMVAVFAPGQLRDDVEPAEACARLRDLGATVVGMNCFRGPVTSLPILEQIAAKVPGPLAAMPVAFRTTPNYPTFFNLPDCGCPVHLPVDRTFPTALEAQVCNRYEMADFAVRAKETGIDFLGVCCGGSVIHHRAVAEALGRTPPMTRYSPQMEKHFLYGSDPTLKQHNTAFGVQA